MFGTFLSHGKTEGFCNGDHMIISFDYFDKYEQPDLILCYPASRYVGNAPTHTIGSIPFCSAIELNFNFNDISELRFRASIVDSESELYKMNAYTYNMLQKMMYIFVKDIGYFRIQDVSESITQSERYKDIEAQSCEVEFAERDIQSFDNGRYLITEMIYGELVAGTHSDRYRGVKYVVPHWNLNAADINEDIDADLLPDDISQIDAYSRYITYEDSEHNAYDFMVKSLQDTFNCVFTFDIINRRIKVLKQSNYVAANKTAVHLSRQDVVREIITRESRDSAVTALAGYTGDGASITPINPTGDAYIYNFGEYIDWLPEFESGGQTFKAKVIGWTNDLNDNTNNGKRYQYLNFAKLKARQTVIMTNKNSEIERLESLVSVYRRCIDNLSASYATDASLSAVDLYNDDISDDSDKISVTANDIQQTIADIQSKIDDIIGVNGSLAVAEAERDAAEGQVNYANNEMKKIREGTGNNDACDPRFRFTDPEFKVLNTIMFMGTYTDNTLTMDTWSESPELDKIETLDLLYDNTKYKLYEISKSVLDFDVSTDSFIFISKFQKWTQELHTGAIINVEVNDGEVEQLHISSMTINYEDQSSSFTFSAAIRNNNARALFNDVFDGVTVKKR